MVKHVRQREPTQTKTRRDSTRIRVFVDEKERALIQANADVAGLSVSAFLRNVGVGYPVRSIVDLKQIAELAKINADLGRLGGLLKLWLTGDPRLDPRRFPHIDRTIAATLGQIEASQSAMRDVMDRILASR
ncbi:conjugal transfer protein TraJ [Rhodanobacter sp. DHB23]|uniref:plasmid mobilization protein n=1 Tax=Rhodanobacter sp. DHB23 TaxID=2775923 RepID=UPI00177F995F|nr:conjugal transfer protein TraJ [Rhodanobacter sp. DHB23]MBD8872875.1 conjugal transfer protein TraJ [Rhodanobacter sp. DHB23]